MKGICGDFVTRNRPLTKLGCNTLAEVDAEFAEKWVKAVNEQLHLLSAPLLGLANDLMRQLCRAKTNQDHLEYRHPYSALFRAHYKPHDGVFTAERMDNDIVSTTAPQQEESREVDSERL